MKIQRLAEMNHAPAAAAKSTRNAACYKEHSITCHSRGQQGKCFINLATKYITYVMPDSQSS
jgi:hypothetical protein